MLTTTPVKATFTGNGSSTVFNYSFKVLSNLDIGVWTKPSGSLIWTQKTLTTDYSVGGVGTDSGSITFVTAPANGTSILVLRDSAVLLTQSIDYIANDAFPANTHETALDKLTAAVQELRGWASRTVRVFPDEVLTYLPPASERINKFLSFNGAGDVSVSASADVGNIPWSTTTSGVIPVTDKGKIIPATSGVTVPNNTFLAGDTFLIYNDTGGNIIITAGVTTLRLAGLSISGNRTLAQRGLSSVLFKSPTEAIMSGTGLT
jgi:hypothetical protein